jgi:hypothetical protein
MFLDSLGRVRDVDVPDVVECRACGSRARRLGSSQQGCEGIYHHYRCDGADCPAGGTLVENGSGFGLRRVGPVFGHPDLAVRLADRDRRRSTSAESPEVVP